MKYIAECELLMFPAWSGGKETLSDLTYSEIETVESMLEDLFCIEIPTDTDINDFLWFERDTIAVWLGFEDYEDLLNHRESD